MISHPRQNQPDALEKNPQKASHISFSEIKKWVSCPYARKLAYGDKIKLFEGNTYTAFGTALHETIEAMYSDSHIDEVNQLFLDNLSKAFDKLKEKDYNETLGSEMRSQGPTVLEPLMRSIKDYFGEFEVFSIEEQLYMPIEVLDDYNFKGYVDIVPLLKKLQIHRSNL